MPFMDQVLERLAGKGWYFHNNYLGCNHICIAQKDQWKTTFIYLYGTFVFKTMLFRLCNSANTFWHCMMSIFNKMVEDTIETFKDDFSVASNSFDDFLAHLANAI